MKELLMEKASVLKRFRPAVLVLLLGLALLLIPEGKTQTSPTEPAASFDRMALQQEMERMLREIEGVGSLSLMLMVDAGEERELAEDRSGSVSDRGREEERETLVIGVGGGKQEVVVTRSIYPRFTGALVVCEGAASASVRYAVTEAVGVLTGLASNQISVVKGKP